MPSLEVPLTLCGQRLKRSSFQRPMALAATLRAWREPIACMWRFHPQTLAETQNTRPMFPCFDEEPLLKQDKQDKFTANNGTKLHFQKIPVTTH